MSIVERTIEGNLQPGVAVSQGEALSPSEGSGLVLHRHLIHIEITHIVIITQVEACIHVPNTSTINGAVEESTYEGIPVTIDVFWSSHTSTSFLIVSHLVADAIAGGREVTKYRITQVVALREVVVVGTHALGEGWLQAWVTLGDVERVAVITYVEQVGH